MQKWKLFIFVIKWRLQLRQEKQAEQAEEVEELKSEEITIDDFMKVDLRVATVTACEQIPKADKLLKLATRYGL